MPGLFPSFLGMQKFLFFLGFFPAPLTKRSCVSAGMPSLSLWSLYLAVLGKASEAISVFVGWKNEARKSSRRHANMSALNVYVQAAGLSFFEHVHRLYLCGSKTMARQEPRSFVPLESKTHR